MMELAIGLYILASAGCILFAFMFWMETRQFRGLNEALCAMIVEAQTARQEMVAGITGAINDRAAADEKPRGTAH
jgi:hypothetical protein